MFQPIYKPWEVRKVLDLYSNVKSFRIASMKSGVSKSTIHRWWSSFQYLLPCRGRHQRKKIKRKRRPKYHDLSDELTNLFTTPQIVHLSLRGIQSALLERKCLLNPSKSWLHMMLRKQRITRRRFMPTQLVSTNKDRFNLQVEEFIANINRFKNEEIVCIDETGFCNLGNTIYGYYPKGMTPKPIPVLKRERRSLIMAIHPTNGIIAHSLQNKSFNSLSFLSFLKDDVIPYLPSTVKGIIMDNVSFHRTKCVMELLKSHGLIAVFIPPYTPRCNPIEEVFSILKRHFRTSGSFERIDDQIATAIEKLKLYKDILNNYIHTRDYVATCLKSKL